MESTTFLTRYPSLWKRIQSNASFQTFRNSPINPKPIGPKNGAKARQPGFYLKTTILTKLMRRVCKDQLPRRSGALSPFKNLEIDGIKVGKR